jgi:hypothetical protein
VGFFIVSINVNFKKYFFKEHIDLKVDLGLNKGETDYLKPNISNKQHHSTTRMTQIGDRKSVNLIAKSQSQPKKLLHRKVLICQKLRKPVDLTGNEPFDIMDEYKVCPTKQEPQKGLKKTGVHICMVEPNVYILIYKGVENGKSEIS